eukprot:CAMPEP_0195510840 /NCGR_PEP_ID=MMETSP0794_2-20130614/3368_1 /TAXON_ID=515487 /ORGANISM="Stephanopyxis turris, Strain CCMP 815" /LENGTH=150 /DNA_ID=CAMNT_0040638343 /DNA_START=114 /DNA_END=563 /DNA_ORIENTATION=+
MGIFLVATQTAAQFGVPKVNNEEGAIPNELLHEQEIDTGGEQKSGVLSAQDAANIEEMIMKAKADLETMNMVTKLKGDMGAEIAELKKLEPEEILGAMKETMNDIRLSEYLFKDNKRALKEMEKDGMINKESLKKYKKNPKLLEDETKKG